MKDEDSQEIFFSHPDVGVSVLVPCGAKFLWEPVLGIRGTRISGLFDPWVFCIALQKEIRNLLHTLYSLLCYSEVWLNCLLLHFAKCLDTSRCVSKW